MIIYILSVALLIILSLNAGYVLLFVFAGLFNARKAKTIENVKYNFFGVFIPAYKGDEVILSTMYESLKQNYPQDKFDIIVIADSLQEETLNIIRNNNVKLVEVFFENSTKAKSINEAINKIETNYDYAVVLDIDNIMEPDCLLKFNNRLQNKEIAIQAHRVAKNDETSFAILDAISEEVNNQIFRKGHSNLGLSAALIGSAMAIKYDYFKLVMKRITAVGGFDKDLEVNIISDNITIGYAHDIYVYDEKVSKASVFTNQRRRWLSAQIVFLRKFGVNSIIKSIKEKNLDLFDKIVQFALIPRVILLGFLIILSFGFLIDYTFYYYYLNILKIYFLAILLAIPAKFYKFKYIKAIVFLPKAFALMIFNLFRIKGANKQFIHTPHSVSPNKSNNKNNTI